MTPQLLLTLSPTGQLIVELPGAGATRRQVEIQDKTAARVLKRILNAQLASAQSPHIGMDRVIQEIYEELHS
jgi:hypothetical protein